MTLATLTTISARPATATRTEPSPTTPTTIGATTSHPAPAFRSSIAVVGADDLPASWRSGCPVGVEALGAVSVSHWGFDGEVRTGTPVVSTKVADDIVDMMSLLFSAGFPIERMEPVDVYDGDDNRSMSANNTSAFNCRAVTGGSSWSETLLWDGY